MLKIKGREKKVEEQRLHKIKERKKKTEDKVRKGSKRAVKNSVIGEERELEKENGTGDYKKTKNDYEK